MNQLHQGPVFKVAMMDCITGKMYSQYVGERERWRKEHFPDDPGLTVPEGMTREYRIGEITLPVPTTPLFAWSTLIAARHNCSWIQQKGFTPVILRCEATGARSGALLNFYITTLDELHELLNTGTPDPTTLHCSSIKPLEIIT